MATFFIRTDSTVTGPFTGVELREAALAGIIGPDSVISGTPEGPWHLATTIGLFSEKRIALPHPPDVQVPSYQVRGMSGAFQGPFKLRELIGFAVRGMLPTNAVLQSTLPTAGTSPQPWVPVNRLQILSACLNGDLALIDSRGQIIRLAIHSNATPSNVSNARVPSEVAKNVDENDATAFASMSPSTDLDANRSAAKPANVKNLIGTESSNTGSSPRTNRLTQFLRQKLSFPTQLDVGAVALRLVPLLVSLLLLIGSGTAYWYWQSLPMSRTQVLGDWIERSDDGSESHLPRFGISFKENGDCVIFNPAGNSWSGKFQWAERRDHRDVFETPQSLTTIVDVAEPSHMLSDIQPTDGYVRFDGRGDDMPNIDGHPVQDVFVRRETTDVKIGYLTTVRYGKEGKSMQAAWVTLTKPVGWKPFDEPAELSATSISKVKASELLATYGVPDEARRVYPFDLPEGKFSLEFSNSQVIRYGKTKLIMAAQELRRPEVIEIAK